jgi:hypothetical protein
MTKSTDFLPGGPYVSESALSWPTEQRLFAQLLVPATRTSPYRGL